MQKGVRYVYSKTIHICRLPEKEREKIAKEVRDALKDYPSENRQRLIDEALSGRLCDIEDLIDINKYIE